MSSWLEDERMSFSFLSFLYFPSPTFTNNKGVPKTMYMMCLSVWKIVFSRTATLDSWRTIPRAVVRWTYPQLMRYQTLLVDSTPIASSLGNKMRLMPFDRQSMIIRTTLLQSTSAIMICGSEILRKYLRTRCEPCIRFHCRKSAWPWQISTIPATFNLCQDSDGNKFHYSPTKQKHCKTCWKWGGKLLQQAS